MSKIAQDIILRPIITEESMLGTADKKYTFSVAKDANKIEIARQLKSSSRSKSRASTPLTAAARSAATAVSRDSLPRGKRL